MKNKLLVFITISFLTIACNGQYRECHWSDKYVDSLQKIIDKQYIEINSLKLSNVIKTNLFNQLLSQFDSVVVVSANKTLTIDTLKSKNAVLQSMFESNYYVFNTDTVSIKFTNDSIYANFWRVGEQVNYQLVDGLKRIDLYYNSGEWQQWWMYNNSYWQEQNGIMKEH